MQISWLDIFLGSLIVTLLIQFVWLRTQLDAKAKELFENWKDKELNKREEELAKLAINKAYLELQKWKLENEEAIRKDAIERSKSVISGKVTEHLVPFFPGFKYNPSDVRFLGSPIDLVVFDGLSEGELRKIVFVEIKTGRSSLTSRERSVQTCVLQKNFEYELIKHEFADLTALAR